MTKITPGSSIIGADSPEDLKQPKKPELEVKKDENGNITSFQA